MCFAIISKKKAKNHKANLAEAIDLQINYSNDSNTYFCSFLGKRHLVLNFNIQNKSEEKLSIQLKISPSGVMKKELRWPMKTTDSREIIFPSSAGQKSVKASYDNSPFEIAANCNEKDQTIIVCDFSINSELQLVVISGDERKTFNIDTSRIKDKVF